MVSRQAQTEDVASRALRLVRIANTKAYQYAVVHSLRQKQRRGDGVNPRGCAWMTAHSYEDRIGATRARSPIAGSSLGELGLQHFQGRPMEPKAGHRLVVKNREMKRTRFVLFLLLTVGAWGQQADIPKSFTPPTSD